MTTNDSTDTRDRDDIPTVTHPLGHCTQCGEPLGWVPCVNCNHPNRDVGVADE